MGRTSQKRKTRQMVLLAILTAIVLVMSYTQLGYLKIGALEITFLVIPVAIGAIVLGPISGLWLGFVFGMTSFLQCFSGRSAFGFFLYSLNPHNVWHIVRLFCLCVLTRMMTGFLAGLLFRVFRGKGQPRLWAFPVTTISASLLNTILFLSSLLLLFPHDYIRQALTDSVGPSVFALFWALAGTNAIIEVFVCCMVGAAVSKLLTHFLPNLNAATNRKRVDSNSD